jgi:hypothetical protein
MKLRGLVPNSYIYAYVSDLYLPTIGLHSLLHKIGGPIMGILYINRSRIHECGNWKPGLAVSFLGIHKSDLLCSAWISFKDDVTAVLLLGVSFMVLTETLSQ